MFKKVALIFIILFTFNISIKAEILRIGVLKIEDAAPVVIALKDGIFKKHGIDAKITYFNSALERDAALEAGAVDCVISDPIAAILLRASGYNVKIVSIALGVSPKDGVFSFLASPKSKIKTLKDLAGKTVAISRNSIIEYITDEILKPKGIKVKKIEIRKMPLRVQMLLASKVDAAVLPEPLATYARFKGARLIFSDSSLKKSLSQTVWIFNGSYIEKHPKVIEAFKSSYNESVNLINANPSRYKDTITAIARVPKEILSIYKIPHFSHFSLLTKESFASYEKWLIEKGLLKHPIPYSAVVYVTSH
ncbi:ABC transporter substrate-binding protein [Hippea alviniae]|uniref:ABC transporter substrate-binding protein n=1 Tax=Hippea alviniae TaxID=1279027 RepID=UPI0003B72404|nr:MetQ/NlpA family ABC transporter substrate-binding protein [Hippea alviniae]